MKNIWIVPLLLVASACTHQPLNPVERAALTNVTYTPAVLAAGAYQLPDIKLYIGPEYLNEGGLLPTFYRDIWEALFMEFEQDKLAKKNRRDLNIVKTYPLGNMAKMLDNKTQSVLSQDAFFGERLRQESRNRFSIKVERYGLRRSAQGDNKKVILRFGLILHVELLDSMNKKIFSKRFYAYSKARHTLQAYAQKKSLFQQSAIQAVDNFGDQLKQFLLAKTALTPVN